METVTKESLMAKSFEFGLIAKGKGIKTIHDDSEFNAWFLKGVEGIDWAKYERFETHILASWNLGFCY